MSTKLHDRLRAQCGRVGSAVVIMHPMGPEPIPMARIIVTYPAGDGSGRVHGWVHILGRPPVVGYAGGGGYDKASAALSVAVRNLPNDLDTSEARLRDALAQDDGTSWDDAIRRAGLVMHRAI